MSAILSIDERLRGISRLAPLPRASADAGGVVRPAELAALALTGAVAAALTTFVKPSLGVPGSSILWAVFPLAFGIALVPRRGAGSAMALAAALTEGAFWLGGVRVPGVGALASLLVTGPLLDVALRWGRGGWRRYGAFIVAGAASNAIAFMVRATAMGAGAAARSGHAAHLAAWWPRAALTYTIAGVIAGLVSAATWFHAERR